MIELGLSANHGSYRCCFCFINIPIHKSQKTWRSWDQIFIFYSKTWNVSSDQHAVENKAFLVQIHVYLNIFFNVVLCVPYFRHTFWKGMGHLISSWKHWIYFKLWETCFNRWLYFLRWIFFFFFFDERFWLSWI